MDSRDYLDVVAEEVRSWSYMKFPYIKELGSKKGWYRVGPLALLISLFNNLQIFPSRLRLFSGRVPYRTLRPWLLEYRPHPSETVGGGASGCPRSLSCSNTATEDSVSFFPKPRAARRRLSISTIVERKICPLLSVSGCPFFWPSKSLLIYSDIRP